MGKEYRSTSELINMSNLALICALLAGCFCASEAVTATNAPTTAPLNPVTTAPLNPVTTAPLNPVTTAPVNPVTTMKPVTPIVTTMKPVTPIVTTAPVNPVTTAPVKGCKKKKTSLTIKTFKKVKKVTNAKSCEMLCKKAPRCKVWSFMKVKKTKMCMLQAFMFKKDKKVEMTGMKECMVPNMKDIDDFSEEY